MPSGSFKINATLGSPGGIRHRKILGVDDGVDTTKVRPSDWHADHYDPAISYYAENNTFTSLSASGVVVTMGQKFYKAGRYRIMAHLRTSSMTSAGNPGNCYIRAGGVQITNGTTVDLRPTAAAQFVLFGFHDYTGGLLTFDVFYSREAGTTGFGVNGSTEARFGQKIMVERIGD